MMSPQKYKCMNGFMHEPVQNICSYFAKINMHMVPKQTNKQNMKKSTKKYLPVAQTPNNQRGLHSKSGGTGLVGQIGKEGV
jgi:hypothetical protein